MNRFERMSKAKRGLIVTGALLLALVLLFAVAEGAVRARAWVLETIDAFVHIDPVLNIRVPNPSTAGVLAGQSRIRINSVGFRSPELSLKPASPNTVRLAFLGASTTFCAEVSSNEATWPYLVVGAVQRHYPGVKIEFINAAVVGYTMHDSLVRFEAQVRPYKPDVVFVYDAAADLSWETRLVAIQQHLMDGPLFSPGETNFLIKNSMLLFLAKKNIVNIVRVRQGDNLAYKIRPDFDALAQTYSDAVKVLALSIRDAGAMPVLITFSPRLRREQTADEKEAVARLMEYYFMPYLTPDQMIEGYTAFNNAMRRVASETNAVLVGNESAIPADAAHYVDSVHFRDAGAAAMAKRVTAALLGNPRIDELIKSKEAGEGRQ
jgi:lysophospholipase L1-like esterase